MKKTLLTASAAVLAMAAVAQTVNVANVKAVKSDVKVQAVRETQSYGKLSAEFAQSAAAVTNFAPVKGAVAAELDVTYDKPAGALIEGMEPGAGWYPLPYVYTPGLVEQAWLNYTSSDDAKTKIEYEWSDADGSVEYTTDEDGNGVGSMFGAVQTPVLVATQEKVSGQYQMGQEGTAGYGVWFGGTEEYVNLGMARFGQGCGPYSGFTDLDLYTNTPGDNAGAAYFKSNIVGFAQLFETPNDFIGATSVILNLGADDASSDSPLGGNALHCDVYKLNEDGSLGDIIASAEATDENVIETGGWIYSFEFVFTEEDELFGTVEAPIALNGESILAVFSGFEKVATPLFPTFCSANGFAGGGYVLLEDGTLTSVNYRNTQIPQIDLMCTLTAAIPVAKPTESMPEVLEIPVDGGYAITVTEDGQSYNDYQVYTLNGSIEDWELDGPDWVTIEYDDAYGERGIMLFFIGADALPAGEVGRSGEVVLSLLGKELKVTVVQGEVSAISAVRTENASSKIFNLMGQKVEKANAGIYVQNGVKFIAK